MGKTMLAIKAHMIDELIINGTLNNRANQNPYSHKRAQTVLMTPTTTMQRKNKIFAQNSSRKQQVSPKVLNNSVKVVDGFAILHACKVTLPH
jgi:hypothetical protein